MSFSITPSQFLSEIGWTAQKRGNWLTLKRCPFCSGGESGDAFTFAVHAADGNYFCHRSKCGQKGNFWKLIEETGRNPRNYWGKERQTQKKRYLYK
jgi:hypothetical protein